MSGYNSFYGGRRGASFVIVKNYKTIKEMISAFSQGGDYKTVNYDEYVLIDTESKNDADNGKIFRRGYEYNNNMGGAVYMGQIVGPSGPAPHVEMKTINEVKSIQERDNFTYRRGEGFYKPTENLVPGKYTDDQNIIRYNDEITWAYCSVRDENEKDTTAHIGFKIPYTVVEYEASSVSPYYNRDSAGTEFTNTKLIDRIDDGSHPFYEKFNVKIPKGIKGTSAENITVEYANSGIEPYEGQEDDIKYNRKVLVYNQISYDKNAEGEVKKIYIGDYEMIEDVFVTDQGDLIFAMSHTKEKGFIARIKWIKSVEINEEGQVTIVYNSGSREIVNQKLNYILKTACNKNTAWHLYVLYSDPSKRGKVTYDGRSDWTDLGYIGNGELGAIAAKENDTTAVALAKELPPYSAWLVIEED